MSHERVVVAADTMLPVVRCFPAGSFQRIGLCDHETRALRLGCSHTTARVKLGAAIRELDVCGGDGRGLAESLGYELNLLNNEIHLLDHRKGEAEKELAKLLLEARGDGARTHGDERLRKAEEDVREMERQHDEYVERMGLLRDRVLAEMDRLIRNACVGKGAAI
jgi:hypothetical protein